MQLTLPTGRYDEDERRRALYNRMFDDIEALPGVDTVGAAMVTPLTGNNWTAPLQRVERPVPAGQRPPEVGWQLASRGYFRALRIPLRAGRLFDAHDATGAPVVIVSEAVAERFFPGEQPLGHRVSLGDMQAEIVGIVGNIRRASLADDLRADLYFPFERVMSPTTTLFIRASGDPLAIVPAVRAAVRRLEPFAVVDETRALADIAEGVRRRDPARDAPAGWLRGDRPPARSHRRLQPDGVRVRRRARELGTRLALGATPGTITWLVVRQAGGITIVASRQAPWRRSRSHGRSPRCSLMLPRRIRGSLRRRRPCSPP